MRVSAAAAVVFLLSAGSASAATPVEMVRQLMAAAPGQMPQTVHCVTTKELQSGEGRRLDSRAVAVAIRTGRRQCCSTGGRCVGPPPLPQRGWRRTRRAGARHPGDDQRPPREGARQRRSRRVARHVLGDPRRPPAAAALGLHHETAGCRPFVSHRRAGKAPDERVQAPRPVPRLSREALVPTRSRSGRRSAGNRGDRLRALVPAPRNVVAMEMHASDPAVDPIEGDVVRPSVQYLSPDVGEAQPALRLDRTSGRLDLEQRTGSPRKAGHRLVAPGVAEERPRLSGADAEERGAGGPCSLGHGGQDASLGQRQPVARRGVFAAEPIEGLGQEAQVARRRRRDLAEPVGIGGPEETAKPAWRARARQRSVASRPSTAAGRAGRHRARPGRRSVRCPGYSPMQMSVVRLGRHVQRMRAWRGSGSAAAGRTDRLRTTGRTDRRGATPGCGRARQAPSPSRDPPRSRPPGSARGRAAARRPRRRAPGLRAKCPASTGCAVPARSRAAPARWNLRSSHATPSPTSDRVRAAAPSDLGTRSRVRLARPGHTPPAPAA